MFVLKKSLIFFIIFLCLPILKIKSELLNESNEFTLTSDNQIHSGEGILKANGNVIIEGRNNLKAYADKLIYEKDLSKLYLIGNVVLKNFSLNEIFIENASGDELIIFLNDGSFEFNKKKVSEEIFKTWLKGISDIKDTRM